MSYEEEDACHMRRGTQFSTVIHQWLYIVYGTTFSVFSAGKLPAARAYM
jgi:hypothetical protein